MVAAELQKRNAHTRRLGSRAISRLVEETINRAEESLPCSRMESGRAVIKHADGIAAEVEAYFRDPITCDIKVRRILDFHAGADGDQECDANERNTA
jgi:hypothetical protein